MGNNASSSSLTFLNNAFVHKPEIFILKSIVLIVLFGKINEKLGRKKWDPGFINTKNLEKGVEYSPAQPSLLLSWREDGVSSWKPQVVSMEEESFSCYKNVPDICGQGSCLLLPSGALRTSIPIPRKMGTSSMEEFLSQKCQTLNPSAVIYYLCDLENVNWCLFCRTERRQH